MIELNTFNKWRSEINDDLKDADPFFKEFGALDDKAYGDGAIPVKYKELTGLSISVLSRCPECVAYHAQQCLKYGANKEEIIEALKMGLIGGGSITYPTIREAISILKQLEVI